MPMNFKSILVCLMAAGSSLAVAQQPDPQAILEGARMSATLTKLDEGLEGKLKAGRKTVPIALFLKGENIQFQFSEDGSPWRIFHMRMGDEKFDLFEIIGGKTKVFDRNKLLEPIAGSDLTYEDLAMRFFYWPDPQFEGEDEVGGQDCYRIRVDKPDGVVGRYASVLIWVHKKYGAFMRIRGINKDGKLVKEFLVEDVMQVKKDVWTLSEMQVSSYEPKTGRRTSISKLDFEKPRMARPRGLR